MPSFPAILYLWQSNTDPFHILIRPQASVNAAHFDQGRNGNSLCSNVSVQARKADPEFFSRLTSGVPFHLDNPLPDIISRNIEVWQQKSVIGICFSINQTKGSILDKQSRPKTVKTGNFSLLLWKENGFLRVLQGRKDILCDFFDQLGAPEWVSHVIVDNTHVPNVEGHIVLV